MMYAEEARAIAKEVNERAAQEAKAKTVSYIEKTVMPAVSIAASKGVYNTRVTPSCYADDSILREELEMLGYEVRIERNYITIIWS